ncbi:hypothetical protein GALMADRAFT_276707 [Galerina marginata CBS 339.88]|uniref:TERF2-interacting telomeric protein 1 Myb domain-containing protein n=1 Tax=Galerina marginata (strain CBS 339.88) TaxID=685588 RepID=A0A067TQC8_GALM3|nr:hypothetical protein GALMADRAFT_276707 [Galerina marginata CBS 339.88]
MQNRERRKYRGPTEFLSWGQIGRTSMSRLYVQAFNLNPFQAPYILPKFLGGIIISWPGRMGRSGFTESEDTHLVEYIAKYNPEQPGRLGNKLYMILEENSGNKWPWSKHHSWQSWRERYKKNQDYFDHRIRRHKRLIAQGSKDLMTKKGKQVENESTSNREVAGSVKENEPHAEDPPKEVAAKPEKHAPRRGEDNGKTGPRSALTSVSERTKIVMHVSQNDQQKTVEKPVHPDDYMHELFGSSAEEEEPEEIQKPRNRSQLKEPTHGIYPNLADAPAPTLDSGEPHVPGAFDIERPQLSQEPTPPNSGADRSTTKSSPPLLNPPHKTKKLKKRKIEVDPFETPPPSPPPPSRTIVARKSPITMVEGPYRHSLKRPRTIEDTTEGAWPTKRMKAAVKTATSQDAQPLTKPSAPRPELPLPKPPLQLQQPQQVNAVASSSKVKLPDIRTSNPAHGKDDSTPEMNLMNNFIGHNAPAPPKIAQNAKGPRKINELPAKKDPASGQALEKALPTASPKPNKTRVPSPEADVPSRPAGALGLPVPVAGKGSNDTLPTRPSSDGDPFTSDQIPGKAAEKANAEPYVLNNQLPPRIDLHRQSLSSRPRASTSFPSRPSSGLSMRTSTSSVSKKIIKSRRSASLRRSIAEINLLDEGKEFAVAAAEDLAQVMDAMARRHGVSTEVAIKTYMTTRSIEKTKIVLGHLFQGLAELEQEIYAQMPDLRFTPNDEAGSEDEDEDDTPAGLVPWKYSAEKAEADGPRQPKQPSTSPRRNRLSLTVKPLPLDETLSDYSPPNSSRAAQFARLEKQGRRGEAMEREKRRVSGVFVPQSQTPAQRRRVTPPEDTSPTPQGREVAMQVDLEEDRNEEAMQVDPNEDPDEDMYVRTDDERHEADDEAEQLEEQEAESTLLCHSRALSRRISEGEVLEPALARRHHMLALDVDQDNAETMRQFEAANDPDFLRLMSIKWVAEILGARMEDQKMEGDIVVE